MTAARVGGAGPRFDRGILGRATWGFADQGLSSLTNFALGILVARTVTTAQFGAFGLALVTYWTALGLSRALTSTPLVIRFSGVADGDWRAASRAATGTSLLCGLVGGCIAIVVGMLLGDPLRPAFVALGIGLPGLLVQDCWRYVFFAHGRARSAFANDLVWALIMFPLLAADILAGRSDVFTLTLAWGGGAAVAAIVGAIQAGMLPHPTAAMSWLRSQWDLASRFASEAAVTLGLRQASATAVATLGGLAAVGALRAGDLLLSPLNIAFQGIYLVAVPEGVRALKVSPRRLVQMMVLISAAMGAMVLVWGVTLQLIPLAFGEELLADSWDAALTVILPITLGLTFSGISSGATIGMRALGAAQRSLVVSTIGSTAVLIISIVGVQAAGAPGVAWGVALYSIFGSALWWWQFRVALREHRGRPTDPSHEHLVTEDDPAGPAVAPTGL